MTKTEKSILLFVIVAVIALSSYVLTRQYEVNYYGAAGDTFSSMRLAAIGVNVATITPATLLNSSGRDRVVSRVFADFQTNNVYGTSTIYCLRAATSTNQYNIVGNTNYLFDGPGCTSGVGQGYSKAGFYVMASTTLNFGTGSQDKLGQYLWRNGEYLNFIIGSSTNGTSNQGTVFTNGAGATSNNDGKLGSTTSGVIGVEYYSF